MNKYLRIRERLVYENRRVEVFDDEVQTPDGQIDTYFRLRHKSGTHGVVVVPRTSDGRFGLINIHRYAFNEPSIEFPRGNAEIEEHLEDAARRELIEEIGVPPTRVALLGVLRPDTSIVSLEAHVFRADVPGNAEEIAVAQRSEGITQVLFLRYGEIVDLIRKQAIRDSFTVAAMTLIALDRSTGT